MRSALSGAGHSFFENVRARYVAAAWLLLPFYAPGLDLFVNDVAGAWPGYWREVVASYYIYFLLIVALGLALAFSGPPPIRACLGRKPTRRELIGGLQVTVWLIVASTASAYALFYPLSFLTPEFVEWWYIRVPGLVYFHGGTYPLLANFLMLVFVCGIAPILEETVFRAIVLPRWARKWGLQAAILAESALFAITHPDPVGAFLFAFVMSVLYLKAQSLWLPIFCHSVYNLVAWLAEVGGIFVHGPDKVYTLQEFQDNWAWGVGCAVASVCWAIVYLKRPKSEVRWVLPVT